MRLDRKYSETISGILFIMIALATFFGYSWGCIFRISNEMAPVCIKASGILLTMYIIIQRIIERKIEKKEMILWIFLVIMYMLFFFTIIKYGYIHQVFIDYLLGYCICVIPSVLGGCAFAKKKKEIPLQTVFLIIASIISCAITNVLLVGDVYRLYRFFGINYQVLSYLGAIAFVLSINVFVFWEKKANIGIFKDKRVNASIALVIAVIGFLGVYFGRGRGATLVMLLFFVYFVCEYTQKNKNKKSSYIVAMGLLIIVSILFAMGYVNRFAVSLSNNRLISTLKMIVEEPLSVLKNDGRGALYFQAIESFIKKPLVGNGLGSVFYEVGYYSHNIITDILCEQGVLGITVALIMLLLILYDYKREKYDFSTRSVLIIFVLGVIVLCFSGYYMYNSMIWFAIGYFWVNNGKETKYENTTCR